MISENWKELIKETLEDRLQPAFMIVFGSYAKDSARDDSDLDLAYYSNQFLTSYERFLLMEELAEKCKVNVDLVDLKIADTVFAAQIFTTGEPIYVADKNVFVKERMKSLSMYARLNEQRAEILQGIRERGNIFG
ncbi:nucleotidyltransferase domain-containing protein [Virgibacillus sp. MSP4-1]|uniref:type VII toxin-antitoxin system MntA family adenylyltransferase antitoxin n=1 Tax=Virgibacillus sp. MSP4-1 TaxID=2700081 RepID=UPI0003A7DAAD|nr:nucleotidyltransferase domain-containing protein [Virgibacillus sp. MSP4-1]QHS23987.1 nucleotidyltransferase domain-containing protein [Virgibacillus sp. MSP4-1]